MGEGYARLLIEAKYLRKTLQTAKILHCGVGCEDYKPWVEQISSTTFKQQGVWGQWDRREEHS